MLHVCLSAALYRPVEVHQAIIELDEMKKAMKNSKKQISTTNSSINNAMIKISGSQRSLESIAENGDYLHEPRQIHGRRQSKKIDLVHSVEDLSTDSTIYYKEEKSIEAKCDNKSKREKSNCTATLRRYIDLSLTTNPLFLLMASTVMLMAIGCPHFLFYLPSYARSQGISRNDASLLLR